jgi:hypothetical protein
MEQTLVLTGDLDRLLALEGPAHASRGRDLDRAMSLGLAGRYAEARRIMDDLRAGALLPAWAAWLQAITSWLDRKPEGVLAGIHALEGMTIAEDPEGLFQVGWMFSDLGEREQAVFFLRRAVDRGFYAAPTMAASPAFDVLREDPGFIAVLADAEAGRGKALAAYREAGGEELLGMWAAAFDRLDALLRKQSEGDAR